MKICQNCGNQMPDEATVCPQCAARSTAEKEDKISIGLCILAAFIPLFGIIYWLLKHKETPRRARACGITAIVAWLVSFICSMALSAFLSTVLFGL